MDTKIILEVDEARATAQVSGLLTSQMAGIPVQVHLSQAWDGLAPVLIAACGNKATQLLIDASGAAVIPAGVLQAGARLYLCIDGRTPDGSIRIPTILAPCGMIPRSAADLSIGSPEPPEPDLVAEILQLARSADASAAQAAEFASVALDVKAAADRGDFDGPPGPQGPQGPQGEPGKVDEQTIGDAVEEYMSQHPVSAPVQSVNGQTGAVNLTAKDVNALPVDTQIPDVPSWAMQPNKPSYTASEVGALPASTPIPPAYDDTQLRQLISGKYSKPASGIPAEDLAPGVIPTIPQALPNPHPLTFAGAVTGFYDGGQPVTVNIPQGGGGGDARWEIIRDMTIDEDVASFEITEDDNGNPFALSDMRVNILFAKASANSGYKFLEIKNDQGAWKNTDVYTYTPVPSATYARYALIAIYSADTTPVTMFGTRDNVAQINSLVYVFNFSSRSGSTLIHGIRSLGGSAPLAATAGTRIQIMGVRK